MSKVRKKLMRSSSTTARGGGIAYKQKRSKTQHYPGTNIGKVMMAERADYIDRTGKDLPYNTVIAHKSGGKHLSGKDAYTVESRAKNTSDSNKVRKKLSRK